jgi:hypothetical protein
VTVLTRRLWKTVIGHLTVIKLHTQSGCLDFLDLAASPQWHCLQRVITATGAYAVQPTFPVSMNSSFPSNSALGQTQGGGIQGSATECSALKPLAVGCESRAGRPPHKKTALRTMMAKITMSITPSERIVRISTRKTEIRIQFRKE